MKIWLSVVFLFFLLDANCQQLASSVKLGDLNDGFGSESSELLAAKYNLKIYRYRLTSPRLMQSTTTAVDRQATTYWTNAITSQSYAKGKVGTFYYWDVQGNLRDMKGFIDIAGKNKRGLKLVFPWR